MRPARITRPSAALALSFAVGLSGCITVQAIATHPDGGTSKDLVASVGGEDLGGPESPDLAGGTTGTTPATCADAVAARTPLGCDFWTTPTLNSALNGEFSYGITVSNPADAAGIADVTVSGAGGIVAQSSVRPGTTATLRLPWVSRISQTLSCPQGVCNLAVEQSALVVGGAYHVESSAPVLVHSWNPVDPVKPSTTNCQDSPATTVCHAYTNEASLVLPTSALGTDYIGLARGTTAATFTGNAALLLPGFLTIIGTAPGTTVTIQSSANVEAGTGVSEILRGATTQFTLGVGDVLQLVSKRASTACVATFTDAAGTVYCDDGPPYDLTGTQVTSTAPVAVIGGHACALVPYNVFACDHLEDSIPPTNTWGRSAVTVAAPPWTGTEPTVWRVTSAEAANIIGFDPPDVHAPVTLGVGQSLDVVSSHGFVVGGTGRLALVQLLVGGDYTRSGSTSAEGNPAMAYVTPYEALQTRYDVYAPANFKSSLLVTIPTGSDLAVDGLNYRVAAQPIGSSPWSSAVVPLTEGIHRIECLLPFGATVIGKAAYTAFAYPAGMSLAPVP